MNSVIKIAAVGLVLGTTSLASAQPVDVSTIDQEKILPHLNSEAVIPALKVVTGNHLVAVGPQNQQYVSATASNGLKFEVHFHGCAEDEIRKCRAMSIVAQWPSVKKSRMKKVGQINSDFLRKNALINAGILENGSPYLVRYVIADHGTAQGNVLSEFANFVRVATAYGQLMIDNIGQ